MTKTPWYHKTTIYQIYPRSFHDSNGDGMGDLQGIIQKLDYIRDLGFESIWISPFFASPQADFGYDISSYADIAPEYGTLKDAFQLIKEVHKHGMKIVFDMVMNHTSTEHPWFRESKSSRDNPKADWYLWRDKPNNWQSMIGGSGWHYAEERRQYYWTSFLPFQPDLNYRNPEVKQTMFDIVRFWLSKGVDGFRLDIFNSIYKDADFRNNPFSFRLLPSGIASGFFQEAKYTLNQPECFRLARELRSLCDGFGEKMLLGEVSGPRAVIRKFLGEDKNDGLGLVFDFGMLTFDFSAEYFHHLVADIERHFPEPFMPVYVFSNHDSRRSIKRLDGDVRKAKLLHLLQLTLRGVPCIYYGEEIGMTDARISFKHALDPIPHRFGFVPRLVFDLLGVTINRDEVRTPMHWNGTQNAGFSKAAKTWLPIHDNLRTVNVEAEDADPDSLLNTIRALLKIRSEQPALHSGSVELVDYLPEGVLGYIRWSESDRVDVFLNFTNEEKKFQLGDGNFASLFKLSKNDSANHREVKLAGFGGMILVKVKEN